MEHSDIHKEREQVVFKAKTKAEEGDRGERGGGNRGGHQRKLWMGCSARVDQVQYENPQEGCPATEKEHVRRLKRGMMWNPLQGEYLNQHLSCQEHSLTQKWQNWRH
jgi:hypothetical protein